MSVTALGWVGAFLLAFCGLPELVRTIRTKKCHLGWGLITMWGVGEVLTLIPIVQDDLGAFLVMNYATNIVIISVLAGYKANAVWSRP